MKKGRIVILLVILFGVSGSKVRAQGEAMISQFVMNTMAINPGYTGYREVKAINFLHRSQWIGFEGAPMTDIITFDMVFNKNRKIAIGGALNRDKIGPLTELGLSGSFAYRVRLDRKKILSMGLQAYTGLVQSDFSRLTVGSYLYDQIVEDVSVMDNPDNEYAANFGFGLFFHTPNMFVGLSSPRLLKTRIKKESISALVRGEGVEPSLYLMSGFNIPINRAYDIQPAVLVKSTIGAPLSAGVNVNLSYNDLMKVGLFYNVGEVFGALVQYNVTSSLRLGYSFDFATHRIASSFLSSHELSAAYMFKDLRKRIIYPRRF